ncbi:helix-turn-helix domain-containing protein [Coprococcus sp. OM06-25]|uniref:helix-turn-helix domain-containing protein n=1 Tax=Coprococcus sp. OM06-25 TaxID=2293094 RepID=UPI003FA4465E
MYYLIRSYHNDGMSIRAIAKTLGISRQTVKKYCDGTTIRVIGKSTTGIQQSSPTRLANSFSLVSEKMNGRGSPSNGTRQNVFMIVLSLRRDSPEENPLSERP